MSIPGRHRLGGATYHAVGFNTRPTGRDSQKGRRLFGMTVVYAQHASAGNYHLEIWPQEGRWEWFAKAIKQPAPALPEFTGSELTANGRKKSATSRIGLYVEPSNWTTFGPGIEVPDQRSSANLDRAHFRRAHGVQTHPTKKQQATQSPALIQSSMRPPMRNEPRKQYMLMTCRTSV